MNKTIVENGVVTKFNIRLKLSNKIPAEKQWWVIESALTRAERLGPSPLIKQVNDKKNNAVLVFFKMNGEQRQDFLDTYPPPKGVADDREIT